ncbi:hypothetical protein N0B40_13855 [Chryseobacterium oranimense]|uniref:hypothetical protein n=1 Tax=Chryseobacterium oranimense TaxID=421058 RepID=UPI0021AFBB82|nr:hypothetical protein [Chryseobacterium oranimense]UWX59490.1 hypothetical protein N0B40_13855 [Chryseobacterium oranimense]
MKKIILLVASISSALIYSQVGINTVNPRGTFHVDGLKDNPTTGNPSAAQGANDFTVTSSGSVGIGTVVPDASAILDVNVDGLAAGSKKGLLGPKAALTSQIDQVTIPSPAAGLLVYNLGTGGLGYVGYVFWNGTEWRTFNNASLAPGTLGSITCNGVTLSPGTYTAGTPYTGTMTVPYTGGNGGVYAAQTVGPVNGLTATLAAGNFNVGSGILSYTVSGVPTVSSPTLTTFPLNIGGQTCSATVGAGSVIAPGELVYYHSSIPRQTSSFLLSQYLNNLPIINNTFRVDAFITSPNAFDSSSASVNFDPRLYNITAANAKIWVSEVSTHTGDSHGANLLIFPNNYAQFDDGVYLTYGRNETVTFDITTVDNKWYRVYYALRIDNKSFTSAGNANTTSDSSNTLDNTLEVFVSIQRLY